MVRSKVLLSREALLNKLYALGAKGAPKECWRWPRSKNSRGYGLICIGAGKSDLVHRVSHEVHVGPIPAGLEVDHVKKRGCRFIDCWNPWHLEAVTPLVNNMRSDSCSAKNACKTECDSGHPLSGRNLILRERKGSVQRQCRICSNDASRRYFKDYYARPEVRERLQKRNKANHARARAAERARRERIAARRRAS